MDVLNMRKNTQNPIRLIGLCTLVFTLFVFLGIASCGNNADNPSHASAGDSIIVKINNVDQFNKIIETSGDNLLLIEFYADWCPPCKQLAPVLEKIAKEKRELVIIYKINIDRNRDLANSFHVTGIPHVTFVKNKKTLLSLTGLYPKKMYLKAIDRFSESDKS